MNQTSLHTHLVEGTILVVADGELDLAVASRLRCALREAIQEGPPRVVFDVSRVSLLDASVAGVLAGQLAQATNAGIELRMVGASGVVLEVLEVLDLAKPLGAYEALENAPARPDLPCCTGNGRSAQEVVDSLAADSPWGPTSMPNKAIGLLLAEAAQLAPGDPEGRRLRARAIKLALPAANQIAGRYVGRGEYTDDLLQVAALGLVKAIDGYDPGRGHAFSDYAVPTILGELRRHFRDHGWGMRVPRHLQELVLDARLVTDQLTQKLHRSPAAADVAETLGVTTESVEAAFAATQAYRPQSLSTPVGDGPGQIGEVVGSMDPGFDRVEDWQTLTSVLGELPERSRRILALRFAHDMSQSEIAAEVGISQMHVSRLLKQAYATLRTALVAAN